jgi:hypothetical protein
MPQPRAENGENPMPSATPRSRLIPALSLLLFPALMAAECTRTPVDILFSEIKFSQSPCAMGADGDLAYIAVTKQEDGTYALDITKLQLSPIDETGEDGCRDMGGQPNGTSCRRLVEAPTRILTADEVQQVDAVVSALEEETLFSEGGCVPFCASPVTTVNGSFYGGSCRPESGFYQQLTAESYQLLTDLWADLQE